MTSGNFLSSYFTIHDTTKNAKFSSKRDTTWISLLTFLQVGHHGVKCKPRIAHFDCRCTFSRDKNEIKQASNLGCVKLLSLKIVHV